MSDLQAALTRIISARLSDIETDRDAKKPIIFKRLFNESNISYDWRGRSQNFQSNTQGMLALQRQTFVGGGFRIRLRTGF